MLERYCTYGKVICTSQRDKQGSAGLIGVIVVGSTPSNFSVILHTLQSHSLHFDQPENQAEMPPLGVRDLTMPYAPRL